MKSKLLLVFMMSSFAVVAQTYKYNFFYNLNEKTTGPSLVSQCTTGTYKWEWLPVNTGHVVFSFDKFCGLVFNDSTTNFLASGSYTIELYFKFDTTTGYKKIVDFSNLTADKGFYSHLGKLNLYPNFTSTDSLVFDGKWQYIALTRDETSKKMYLYHNNKVAGTYTDNAGDYKYGINKRLVFFKDDGAGIENGSGKVALIHITNSTLDSNTVKNNYANIKTSMGVERIAPGALLNIYPNPFNNEITVWCKYHCDYTMSDLTGKTIQDGNLTEGNNKIDTENLPTGIYLLKIIFTDGSNTFYKVHKQ